MSVRIGVLLAPLTFSAPAMGSSKGWLIVRPRGRFGCTQPPGETQERYGRTVWLKYGRCLHAQRGG
jgi:hypothetical protein